MLEKIQDEKEMWKNYYFNYEYLAMQVLADVMAFIPKEKRQKMIDDTNELLSSIEESIKGEEFVKSLEMDIESFKRLSNESGIVMRTLQWVEDTMKIDVD